MVTKEEEEKMLKKAFEINFKNPWTNKNYTIARIDYESMPCAMVAHTWTDVQMANLATMISNELSTYEYDTESDYWEDEANGDFWIVMESCAVDLGMQYYEDL